MARFLICKEKNPIFTSAPGGCGKSWPISIVETFGKRCIKPWQYDIHFSGTDEGENDDGFVIDLDTDKSGRFGRVLVRTIWYISR